MFRKSTEQQIMREADKVVSMKEDIDAMSWSRVSEIAKLLQVDHTEEQRLEWARELLSIARTNSWVLDKFGVLAEDMTGRVIPSGIEVQQGDRYLSETTAADMPSAEDEPVAEDSPTVATALGMGGAHSAAGMPVEARSIEAAILQTNATIAPEPESAPRQQPESDISPEPVPPAPSFAAIESEPELAPSVSAPAEPKPEFLEAPQSAWSEPISPAPEFDDSFIETKGVLRKKRRAEKRSRREKREADPFSIPTAAPVDNAVLDFEQIATPGFGQDATSLEDLQSRASATRTSTFDAASSTEAPAADRPQHPEASCAADSSEPASEMASQNVARFKHLYSNRKGSLCLYEDSEGHLVAVDPSRFV